MAKGIDGALELVFSVVEARKTVSGAHPDCVLQDLIRAIDDERRDTDRELEAPEKCGDEVEAQLRLRKAGLSALRSRAAALANAPQL